MKHNVLAPFNLTAYFIVCRFFYFRVVKNAEKYIKYANQMSIPKFSQGLHVC